MNRARIVVLTIAVGAGGVAAWLASGSNPEVAPVQPTVQLQTVDVLVAKSDIGPGQTVTANDVQWQNWPAGHQARRGRQWRSLWHSSSDRAAEMIKGRMI